MPQDLVSAPFLGQLHDRAWEIAVELFELALEPREQRESVRGRAGKSGENLVIVQAAQFFRGRFQHFVTDSHLPVAGHHDFAVAADADHRRRTYFLFHWSSSFYCGTGTCGWLYLCTERTPW